ncbi:DUF4870 domain-containing protein [uncultured Salegentibacter sp.]|uniref:DUF4870 domain-containing protein n=1 Tax=uncultured Salegentibacter sp. TaxID=259320 RepID=UPI002595DFDC|nr:DUF4870 domain-containing protein [uncultured Salegentibacter sp.]
MSVKTISIVSYLTIIGWIIAYFSNKNQDSKSELASYHLGQSMGIFIFGVILNIILGFIANVVSSSGVILFLLGLVPLIFIILGIITANNEALKPVPIIGTYFEGKFNF